MDIGQGSVGGGSEDLSIIGPPVGGVESGGAQGGQQIPVDSMAPAEEQEEYAIPSELIPKLQEPQIQQQIGELIGALLAGKSLGLSEIMFVAKEIANSDLFSAEEAANMGATTLLLNLTLRQQEIVSAILDKWIESLQEQEKRVKEELNSPRYLAELARKGAQGRASEESQEVVQNKGSAGGFFQKKVQASTNEEKGKLLDLEAREAILMQLKEAVLSLNPATASDVLDLGAIPSRELSLSDQRALLSSALQMGAEVVYPISPEGKSEDAVSREYPRTRELVSDILEAAPQSSHLDTQAAASVSMFVASMMASIWMGNVGTMLLSTDKGARSQLDQRDMAKGLAASVASHINNEGFDRFLLAIVVPQGENLQQLDLGQREKLIAPIKISILSLTLAALHIAAGGQLDGNTLAKLLYTPGPIKERFPLAEKLGQELNRQLDLLPDDQREAVLKRLESFFNRSPDLEELYEPLDIIRTYQERGIPVNGQPV